MKQGILPLRTRVPGSDAGFSLIETIVALTLLAAMLAMVPGTLRLASRAWQAQDGIDRIDRVTGARAALMHHLAQAVPLTSTGPDAVPGSVDFAGEADGLTFVAPAPQSAASAGLVAYHLHRTDPDGAGADGDLALTMRARPTGDQTEAEAATGDRRTVMLENVGDLSLRYFGAPESGGAAGWQNTWRDRDRLPTLIELSFSVRGAGGMQREVLVVEPRLRAGR